MHPNAHRKILKLLTMAFQVLSPPDSAQTTHTHSSAATLALLLYISQILSLIATSGPLHMLIPLLGTPPLPFFA